jgi:hypothetical protein
MMNHFPHPSSWRTHLRQACAGLVLLAGVGAVPAHAQDVPPAAPANKSASQEPSDPDAYSEDAPLARQPVKQDQPAADKDKDSSEDMSGKLNEIIVQGHHDTLGDSDKRLKALQNSLPCNGCDAKPRKKKFMRKVLDAVADRVLPTAAPDHSNYDPNDKTLEFSQQGQCIGVNVNQCIPSNANP